MTRPPWLTGSSVQTLIDRLNAWLRYLSEKTTAVEEAAPSRMLLGAGMQNGTTGTVLLNAAGGCHMSLEAGYVMPRAGSITACSISILVTANV